ncbi:MAG: zinc ribbon domain-containing protein, partial [Bryobacterales bacterium]|nr:zinc ribbon domain-containing protein [Bryobacterales bacterium]
MPIYEYKCAECGNVYEKRQKFSDPVDTNCHCEKKGAVSRITSAPALVFKGSGWYINDYARAGQNGKTATAKDNGGSPSGASSTDSATSTKSDTASSSSSASSPT